MKTKRIEINKRWRAQPEEAFCLEMKLYLSQKEVEKTRNIIFEMIEEGV